MASLYSCYIKEREGFDIVETGDGFVSYQINGDECYVRDIYVVPEKRRERLAQILADNVTDIARKANCKFLSGTIYPSKTGSTESMKALIWYGFKIRASTNDCIVLVKEL